MIDAHFEGKKLIIDTSNIDDKYLGKKLHFKLMYGIELTNGENEIYGKAGEVKFEYNRQSQVEISVKKIETGYRGEKIWIGYFIQADFGSKMLIFRDKKDIDISGRDNEVYHVSNIKDVKSGLYRGYSDKKDRKKIMKTVHKNFFKDVVMFIPNIFKSIISYGWLLGVLALPFVFLPLLFLIIFSISSYIHALIGLSIYIGLAYFFSYMKHSTLGLKLNYKTKFQNDKNIGEFLSGKATKNIENIEIQIFGINEERGWYEYDCGSSTCTAYINHEVGNVLLFSKKINYIASGENIGTFLNEKLDLEKMYVSLFPEQVFSSSMGFFTLLEFRIISDDYSDEIHKIDIQLNNHRFKKQVGEEKIGESLYSGEENSDFFV